MLPMRDLRMFVLGLLALPIAAYVVTRAFAGSVTIPHTFVADTPALAEEVNANFAAVATQINDNDARILALEAALAAQTARLVAVEHTGPVYRWAVWSTYDQGNNQWFASNDATMFGGVTPQVWADGDGVASQMSSDKDVLRMMFTGKGYGGRNATVVSEQWVSYSSTNARHSAALFRIRNTTAAPIDWTVKAHQTAYPSWGERASVALNGALVWQSTTTLSASDVQTHVLSIPADRVSTAIFISGSTQPVGASRALYLAFRDACLTLPAGLEYVDDFDTATGGWSE